MIQVGLGFGLCVLHPGGQLRNLIVDLIVDLGWFDTAGLNFFSDLD
jgi:hypothetical protein